MCVSVCGLHWECVRGFDYSKHCLWFVLSMIKAWKGSSGRDPKVGPLHSSDRVYSLVEGLITA